ncbi:Glutamyl-tRNA(Gln) amidotransferase subunit A [Abeliophyllum distichum]|uniref:Glutamyl-tRNA(Gln) amidotransferase subunit A n=1 Tax=Abeliophyllum distichum TaxID=126358 RepID=A0ABD1P979_9LAMI
MPLVFVIVKPPDIRTCICGAKLTVPASWKWTDAETKNYHSQVLLPSFSLGLPAYYVLASSESSFNLSRYDGIRYGNQVLGDELNSLYGYSRAQGFGSEVKMRILMGTYALSAGYYDAYYKRAQQVRTVIRD